MGNLSTIVKSIKSVLVKHGPEISVGLGVGCLLTSTVLAVKATPEALKRIEAKKAELETDKLTPGETVKATWKCYIPAAAMAIGGASCTIGGLKMDLRRNAALATAYSVTETALREYKEKVVETIGEKKEKVIHEAIAKDKVEATPVESSKVIITGKGEALCFDALSGQYFRSDIESIKRAVNEVNECLIKEGYISLNEFYDKLGLEMTKIGYDIGWHIDKGLIDVDFDSTITKDGTPCLVLNYTIQPMYDYDKWL